MPINAPREALYDAQGKHINSPGDFDPYYNDPWGQEHELSYDVRKCIECKSETQVIFHNHVHPEGLDCPSIIQVVPLCAACGDKLWNDPKTGIRHTPAGLTTTITGPVMAPANE